MGIDREDIERIAKATADEVTHRLKGNPIKQPMYSQCSCGMATVNMLSNLYYTLEDYKQSKEISPVAKMRLGSAFRELEHQCPADMAQIEDVVTKIKGSETISEPEMEEAISGMFRGFTGCMEEAMKD